MSRVNVVLRFTPLVICAASLPALSRWFLPQLPSGADTAIHFFRAVELDWLIRHGIPFSRWLPDLVFGYGYPLFNYYGPLANYIIVAFHFLGLPFVSATLATFVLADLLGAFGAYLFARDTLGGKLPGLVTAIAYAYSPYLLASLYRGTLPEALTLGLLPWLLWAFHRLWHQPGPLQLIVAAILLALFPLINNPGAVLATGTLFTFLTALAFISYLNSSRTSQPSKFPNPRPHNSNNIPWRGVVIALALGLGLTAFFWLPVPFEINYVQINRAFDPAITNFRTNFLSPGQLFALPKPLDLDQIGGSVEYGLGLPQLILAGFGLINIRRQTREARLSLVLAAVSILVLIFFALPPALWLWERLPGLSLIQLPARLLGPASLWLALLAGAAFDDQRRAVWLIPIASAAILLFGFGWMFTATDRSLPAQPTVADIHIWEHRTGVVGTTSAGEFLPIWVEQRLPDNSLQPHYSESLIPNRLDLSSLPEGARIISQTPGLLAQKVELESPTAFIAVFNLFYFPGWAATIDGEAVTVTPTPVAGLASFPIPAGRHILELYFTDTPPRTLGNIISLVALIVLGLVALRLRPTTPKSGDFGLRNAHRGVTVAIAGVGLAIFGIKLLVVDRPDLLFLHKRFDGQTLSGLQYPLEISFGDQLQLLGYDEANGEVILFWRALQELDSDWSVSVTLDYEGHRVAQNDLQHPGGLPTSRWFPEQYARDAHPLNPIPGTPPGAYDLRVTVYRQSDGAILQPAAAKIGEWDIKRPAQPANLESNLLNMPIGPIEIIGITPRETQATVGQTVPLILHWHAGETPADDLQIEVWFTGENGPPIYTQVIAPTRPDFGTSQWEAGDEWIGFVDIKIPPEVPSGYYFVGIVGPEGILMVERIRVTAPDRIFESPRIANRLNVQFGEMAELLGWDYSPSKLTLYWQSLVSTNTSYTVFIHVLDAGGTIIAQRDNPPANGLRLTPSWLPPEIITDSYELTLPPETAAIRIGLYDPTTGQRLATPEGNDFVLIQP